MPRKSADALSTLRVDGEPARLRPPAWLAAEARQVFVDLVAACDARHFTASDLPLLCTYCESFVLSRQAIRELRKGPVFGGKMNPWMSIREKATRELLGLALRLRICPQSRQDPKTAHRRAQGPGPSAYEWTEDGP